MIICLYLLSRLPGLADGSDIGLAVEFSMLGVGASGSCSQVSWPYISDVKKKRKKGRVEEIVELLLYPNAKAQ